MFSCLRRSDRPCMLQSERHVNKVVLWPGCGGRTEFSLHAKNGRSVWFVVKRRECCCNLLSGVALIVWFTTNGMCMKNNTIIYVAQAIVRVIATWKLCRYWLLNVTTSVYEERLRRMISIVACCQDAKLCAHATRVSDRNSLHWAIFALVSTHMRNHWRVSRTMQYIYDVSSNREWDFTAQMVWYYCAWLCALEGKLMLPTSAQA